MLLTQESIVNECKNRNIYIYDLAIEDEIKRSGTTKEDIYKEFSNILHVMRKSALKYLSSYSTTATNMIDGFSTKMMDYFEKGDSYIGDCGVKAMAMAFSTIEVNATMGKIVAAPTAGASGILPAAVLIAQEKFDFDDETLIKGLITAGYVGRLIGRYFNFAGAEGGCQAECGSAASMAAAALTQMKGGSVEQCFDAASFALLNVMGLVCDPVAGLVEFPCTFRNSSGVINALICADIALADVKSFIPYEEVLTAANNVGKALPYTLRETSLGGVAMTASGLEIKEKYQGIIEQRRADLDKITNTN